MNCVDLEFIIIHAKFHDHRTNSSVGKRFLKVFTIYGHVGHLSHVTWTSYINFLPRFPRRLHMKFGFDWRRSFREKDL